MRLRSDNPGAGKIGRAYPPVDREIEHFYVCPRGGQAVDKRDLAQLIHHALFDDHKSLPLDG